MNAFKYNNLITISFSNGDILTNIPYTEENWKFVLENKEDESLVYAEFAEQDDAYITEDMIAGSNLLVFEGDAVVMPLVSQLSIPKDIVFKIISAERSKNQKEINKWVNFWTFVSMNPNEAVRDNIFWFINKWGIQITESGLLRAYRNVDIKEYANPKYTNEFIKNIINSYYTEKYVNGMDPDDILDFEGKSLAFYYNDIMNECNDSPTYTDHHSHTFEIKLGQPVRMPREECDEDSTVSCSRGLHLGGPGWLEQNYFGSVGLECLVNPANIVAIPVIDDYGKLRCCEYFPIAIVDFDYSGHVIVPEMDLYYDIKYLETIKHEGEVNNREGVHYSVGKTTRESLYNAALKRLKA